MLLVGDTHANAGWIHRPVTEALIVAEAEGTPIDVVVQLGDFGYWPGTSDGDAFLCAVSELAVATDVPVLFVDGNHEDHAALHAVSIGEHGTRPVAPGVWHLPRGTRWTWSGERWGALGGAVSPDQLWRREGSDWFPGREELQPGDVARLGGEDLDVLACHDAPAWSGYRGTLPMPRLVQAACDRNRILLGDAITATRPNLVAHGHWHLASNRVHRRPWGDVRLLGLNCDGSHPSRAMAIHHVGARVTS